jgi:hypothetical protein
MSATITSRAQMNQICAVTTPENCRSKADHIGGTAGQAQFVSCSMSRLIGK